MGDCGIVQWWDGSPVVPTALHRTTSNTNVGNPFATPDNPAPPNQTETNPPPPTTITSAAVTVTTVEPPSPATPRESVSTNPPFTLDEVLIDSLSLSTTSSGELELNNECYAEPELLIEDENSTFDMQLFEKYNNPGDGFGCRKGEEIKLYNFRDMATAEQSPSPRGKIMVNRIFRSAAITRAEVNGRDVLNIVTFLRDTMGTQLNLLPPRISATNFLDPKIRWGREIRGRLIQMCEANFSFVQGFAQLSISEIQAK